MGEVSFYKVAIIGGGAAGLAAASYFCQNGLNDIILLEAQDRIGGRIHTITHDNQTLELGAQWIHGEDGNCVYEIASKKDLIDNERKLPKAGIWSTLYIREDGAAVSEDLVDEIMNTISNIGGDDLENVKESLGKYYLERFSKVNEWGTLGHEMLDWYGKFLSSTNGTDSWFNFSGNNEFVYEECPGNLRVNWKNGYSQLLEHFKSSIPEEKILINSPVKRVHWQDLSCSDNRVKLELENGKIIHSDHVIMTPSLAVLKESACKLFHPPLPPRKIAAINGLGIDIIDKIYLKFPYPFWKEDCLGFTPLYSSDNSRVNNNNWEDGIFGFYVTDNPDMLFVWIGGRSARLMEATPLEEVRRTCEKVLKNMLRNVCQVPDAIWCARSRWFSNPWIRGSYSYRSVSSEMMDVHASDLAYPLLDQSDSPVLCFAGEATHSRFYSTVHGAVETGFREAKRILKYLSKNSVPWAIPSFQAFYEVVVVGAGAAGLEAAKEFLKHGIKSIIILEASDRIGGRVNTIPTANGPIELGAQWIHGEVNNKLFDIGNQHELVDEKLSLDGGGEFLTEHGENIPSELVEEVSEVMQTISLRAYSNLPEDVDEVGNYSSIGDFYHFQFTKYLNSCNKDTLSAKHLKTCLYHWVMRWERIDNACDSLHQLSAHHWKEFKRCSGRDNMNPKFGMSSLIHNIFDDEMPVIRTNSEVIKIMYSKEVAISNEKFFQKFFDPPVSLVCSNGLSIGCNHVLVTCPLGYLKSHRNLFSPPLPLALQTAVNNTGFGTLDKIYLEFDHKWWKSETIGFQFVWTETIPDFDRRSHHTKFLDGTEAEMKNYWYYGISGFDALFDGRSTLCGWIGGPEAEFMESLPEHVVTETCMMLLRKFTGDPSLPNPVKMHRSKWASDPFFCGTYCYRGGLQGEESVTSKDLNIPVYATDSLKREVPIIALAGEANSFHYFSTVHGAIDNGRSQTRHYLHYRKRFLASEIQSKL